MKVEDVVRKIADYPVVNNVVKIITGVLAVVGIPLLVPFQDVYEGIGESVRAVEILKQHRGKKALIVTDKTIMKLGIPKPMLKAMDKAGFPYVIYDDVEPNPTIKNIEDAFALYCKERCDCIVGIGGGSAMDTAKIVGCRVLKPEQSVVQMGRAMGAFPITLSKAITRKLPFTIAIPTTAGTGAETTAAAVVSDHEHDRKYSILDFKMRPHVAILDATLFTDLPPYVTVCTAIDALCHNLEGYIGGGHNLRGDEYAIRGFRLALENIDKAYNDGKDIEARQNLCKAAYYGGLTLNFELTGYVHPFCHKIGAKYNLAHGRCIGTILPIILEEYGKKIEKRLAKFSVAVGVGDPNVSPAVQAKQLIQTLRDISEKYGIPDNIPELEEAHFDEIVDSIMIENFVYPTVVSYTRDEIIAILRKIKG
ncbi:MAG: iron-containing alcohol dehydrogenase [Ruminococcaceae bacterium]|nr:iron-containing alcohol dehydrogenase [Oscillospiraceae bacterium]